MSLNDQPWPPACICKACNIKLTRAMRILHRQTSGNVCWNIPQFSAPETAGSQKRDQFEEFLNAFESAAEEHSFINVSDEGKAIAVTL